MIVLESLVLERVLGKVQTHNSMLFEVASRSQMKLIDGPLIVEFFANNGWNSAPPHEDCHDQLSCVI